MRTGGIRGVVAVALAGALLAACGSTSSGGGNESSAPPATELADSVQALSAGHALDLTFSLGLTSADIAHISAVEHDTPPPAVQKAMTQDHVRIAMQAPPGGSLAGSFGGSVDTVQPTATTTPRPGSFAVTFGDAHADYFAFESVGGSWYGRIDLPYFLSLGGNRNGYAQIQRQVAGMPAFVRAAVRGQWVGISADTLKALSGFAQGIEGSQGITPKTPKPSKVVAFSHRLLSTLLADLTVTRVSSGTVDHLAVTFPLRQMLTDEYAVIRPFFKSLVPFRGAFPAMRPSTIPALTPRFDAYVTGGALSRIVFDAGQFDRKHHIHAPIVLTISRQGPAITAPSGSVPVDLSSIGQLIGAAGAGA